MTEDEAASKPGAVATRSEEVPVQETPAVVFTPNDFRLNLEAKLADPVELLTDLDKPSIRKLTWEQVVPERLESAEPIPPTTVESGPPHAPHEDPPPPLPEMPPDVPVREDSGSAVDAAIIAPVVQVRVEKHVDADPTDTAPDPVAAQVAELVAAEGLPAVDDQLAEVAAPCEEINRLASVPDMVLDDTPVELPPIAASGPVVPQVRSVYTPVLPETLLAVSPRPTPPNVAAIVAESNAAWHRSKTKRKRHILRSFFSLVLVLGLLGGGAYAARKYLMRQPQWPEAVKPLATEVEDARSLKFKAEVDIIPMPVADYATRLAASTVDPAPEQGAAWRALGLLNGELDLAAIGSQAMNDSPAFYEWSTKTILVSDDLAAYEHLYRFAVRRALAAALLDQQLEWSSRLASASPAAALALRATIDADALAIANSLALRDAPDQLAPELLTFAQAHGNPISPSQFAATITGRAGAALRPAVAAMADPAARSALEQETPTSDAAFDAVRPETAVPAAPDAHGLMFWYYVLGSRIDDNQAWSAAVRWTGDSLATVVGASTCVDASVAASDPDGAAVLLTAFQSWAAAAPVESATTVAAGSDNQILIHACDPGPALTAQVPPKVPVAFGGAGVEQALVQAAVSAASATKVDAACLIAAARQRAWALASPADDAPVLAVDWKPPYVDANLDLATGCVAAAPEAVS